MRPSSTSTRLSPTGTTSTRPPWPAAVGGVKPGRSAIATTCGRLAEFGGGGRPARAEHHRDVERVDAGARLEFGGRGVGDGLRVGRHQSR